MCHGLSELRSALAPMASRAAMPTTLPAISRTPAEASSTPISTLDSTKNALSPIEPMAARQVEQATATSSRMGTSGRGRPAGRSAAGPGPPSADGAAPMAGTPSDTAKASKPPSTKAQLQPMVRPTAGTASPPSSDAVGMPDFWTPRARPWRRLDTPRAT